jgi:hypothetical protein
MPTLAPLCFLAAAAAFAFPVFSFIFNICLKN